MAEVTKRKDEDPDKIDDSTKSALRNLANETVETEGDYNKTFGTNESDPDKVEANINIGTEPRLNSVNRNYVKSSLETDVIVPWSKFTTL